MNEIENLKLEGNRLFRESKFENAIKIFNLAIEKAEQMQTADKTITSILYSNISNCFLNLGNFQEALNNSEKVISLNPNWFKGYYRKGRALFALNKIEARKSLKIAYNKIFYQSFKIRYCLCWIN